MPHTATKRFGITVSTVDEAERFLDLFSRKIGTLNGSTYRCSETCTFPETNGIGVTVFLSPWEHPIEDADEVVSFEKLIRETGATEITA